MAMVFSEDIMRSNLLHHHHPHHVEHTNTAPSTLGYRDSYLCSGRRSPTTYDDHVDHVDNHKNRNRIQSEDDEVYAALSLSQSSAFEPHNNHNATHHHHHQFIKPTSPQHLHLRTKVDDSDIQQQHTIQDKTESELSYDRTPKVAKTTYSDHGTHGLTQVTTTTPYLNDDDHYNCEKHHQNRENKKIGSIVKLMTCSLEKSYSQFKKNERNRSTTTATTKPIVENSSNGSSMLSASIAEYQQQTNQGTTIHSSSSSSIKTEPKKKSQPAGLLHAALLDSGLDVDNHRHQDRFGETNQPIDANNNNTHTKKPRKCLTAPSEPELNSGLDNEEGNLIVYTNDFFRVPNQNIHQHSSKFSVDGDKKFGTTSFEVLDILGQGTFAQVFKCRKCDTGEIVAIKIVKNKPAYTRQAAIEIDIFQALSKEPSVQPSTVMDYGHAHQNNSTDNNNNQRRTAENGGSMVSLLSYFMYHSHLCLVFELLGFNLYEVLKQRQFCGLSITVVRELVKQAIQGIKQLSLRNIVHCDLKPENILMVDNTTITTSDDNNKNNQNTNTTAPPKKTRIKLIDFGSACFEGQTTHTYIQSRFYRSPEVLMGLDYDSAVDMWSLGCVAAELFLGLPILPGLHEHDQLGRICEMIGEIPNWMIEQGTKSSKYFEKCPETTKNQNLKEDAASSLPSSKKDPKIWRLKTREEFIQSLSQDEVQRRGGLKKLEQQPTNRYFKRKELSDIVMVHGSSTDAEKELLSLFCHFLNGVLDPDPWKRWTAHQASMHPFLTGQTSHIRPFLSSQASFDIHWVPPWDPSICRRKLLCVQKARDRQKKASKSNGTNNNSISSSYRTTRNSLSRSFLPESTETNMNEHPTPSHQLNNETQPADHSSTTKMTPMIDAMSLSQSLQSQQKISPQENFYPATGAAPPNLIGGSSPPQNVGNHIHHQRHFARPNPSNLSCSLGKEGMMMSATAMPLPGMYLAAPPSNLQGLGEYMPTAQSFQNHHQRCGADPQSLSGVYFESIPGGDLGYALQRPGVVPMGGECNASNNSTSMMGLQGGNHPSAKKMNRHVRGYGRSNSYSTTGRTKNNLAPTSPHRVNNSDKQQLGGPESAPDNSAFSLSNDGHLYGTSLLAQQLAEHSSSTSNSNEYNNMLSNSQHSYAHLLYNNIDGVTPTGSMNSLQGYHHMGYMSAHGTPMYMSSSNPPILRRSSYDVPAQHYMSPNMQTGSLQGALYQNNNNTMIPSQSLPQQNQCLNHHAVPPNYMQQQHQLYSYNNAAVGMDGSHASFDAYDHSGPTT